MFTKIEGLYGWDCGTKTIKILDDDGDSENGPNPNAQLIEAEMPCAIYKDKTGTIEVSIQHGQISIKQIPNKGRENTARIVQIPLDVINWLDNAD